MQNASNIPLVHVFAVVACCLKAADANMDRRKQNVGSDRQERGSLMAGWCRASKGLRLQINSQHTGSTAESYFGEVAFRSALQ